MITQKKRRHGGASRSSGTAAASHEPSTSAHSTTIIRTKNALLFASIVLNLVVLTSVFRPNGDFHQQFQQQQQHHIRSSSSSSLICSSSEDSSSIIDKEKVQEHKSSHTILHDGMPSVASGFRPVYVFSSAKIAEAEIPTRESVKNPGSEIMPYSQVNQDRIIFALTRSNDEKMMGFSKRDSTLTEQQSPQQQDSLNGGGDAVGNGFFFVDLASNAPIELSNTLYLEQNGWNGICIEGSPEYWYGLGRYRKCTIIGAFVGGANDGTVVDVVIGGVLGGLVGPGMDNTNTDDPSKALAKRELVSIRTVLRETNAPKLIDYFSLDVEGAESLVMADFPWQEYTFRFLTIERPKDDLKALLSANGYKPVKQLIYWGEELWMHDDSVVLSGSEIEAIITAENLSNY